jgi:hypothetical protein
MDLLASLQLTADGLGLAILLGGGAGYLALCAVLRRRKPPLPLAGQFFLLFATYASLLFVLLAGAFKTWSDAATLATMYLVLAAPFLLLIIAAQLRRIRRLSVFHKIAFYAALLYPALWVPIVGFYFLAGVRSISGE